MEKSKIVQITDLVDYQPGAIVSKIMTESDAASVTIFAFDAGQELSEHTSPFDAMVQIIDGEADITISDKPFHLHPGEMIIMPADVPHAVYAKKKFKMMLIMIQDTKKK